MQTQFGIVLLVASIAACQSRAPQAIAEKPNTAASATAPATPPNASKPYGAAISLSSRSKLSDVLKAPEEYAGRPVLVEGYVRKACTRRGCWMELAESAEPSAAGCRVAMKDHMFFVPTDSAGSTALVQGTFEYASLPQSYVDHLEQEGATFGEKRADGSAREVRMVASGVELKRP